MHPTTYMYMYMYVDTQTTGNIAGGKKHYLTHLRVDTHKHFLTLLTDGNNISRMQGETEPGSRLHKHRLTVKREH